MTEVEKPVTKTEMRAALHHGLSELRTSLSEQMRDSETAILKAFHRHAVEVAAQIQKLNRSKAATEIRLAALESRVLELETRRRSQ